MRNMSTGKSNSTLFSLVTAYVLKTNNIYTFFVWIGALLPIALLKLINS